MRVIKKYLTWTGLFAGVMAIVLVMMKVHDQRDLLVQSVLGWSAGWWIYYLAVYLFGGKRS